MEYPATSIRLLNSVAPRPITAKTVTVDPEFQSLIPPLSEDELDLLEQSILADGCRDALIVWQGHNILVDGHNRYAICQKYNLSFKVIEKPFDCRESALIWIIQNQFGRRNLTPFVRSELALKLKAVFALQARVNLVTSTGGNEPRPLQKLAKAGIDTRVELAKVADVSGETIRKVEAVTSKAPEQIKQAARNGDIAIDRAFRLTKALDGAPEPVIDLSLKLANDEPEKVEILKRLHASMGSPTTNGTFQEIADTGGFAYGDEMDQWVNFKDAPIETIHKGLSSIAAFHAIVGGKHKPKTNRAGDEYVAQGFDACQTPVYALDPLLPYLQIRWTIWEPAAGEHLLVDALYDSFFKDVVTSDILTGQNFFTYAPEKWDCLITNPPYSIKYKWLERCYELGKPFALLLPVETLGAQTAQDFFREHGVEVIFLNKRVNFKMPEKGWDGGGAQFPVAWFTWGLNIGQQMTFARFKDEAA